ncbi:hypothetical protein [Amnibacterium kyonggiense]
MRTDDLRACRYCGDPLPDRKPGQRGRPRVVHEGRCHRLYRNRQKMDARYALFRAAHRPDRSDDALTAPWGYGIDVDDVAEGFSVTEGRVWDGRAVPTEVLEAWEADERTRRRLVEAERVEIRAEVDAALAAFYALPETERFDRLRAMAARRRERAGFRTQPLY